MLRSLFAGVSGMRNNQIKMDVIGNNIANVNTTAFKSGRVRFQDIFSQTIKDAMPPAADGMGGTNPRQIGLGMQVAGIDTMTNQGSLQPTNRMLDCGIQKEGFFILSNRDSSTADGASLIYTRDGAFSLDENGNLINSDGYKVMGLNPYYPEGAESLQKVDVTQDTGEAEYDLDDGVYTIRTTKNYPGTPLAASNVSGGDVSLITHVMVDSNGNAVATSTDGKVFRTYDTTANQDTITFNGTVIDGQTATVSDTSGTQAIETKVSFDTELPAGRYTIEDISSDAVYGGSWNVALKDAGGNIIALGASDTSGTAADTAAEVTNWVDAKDTAKSLLTMPANSSAVVGDPIMVTGSGNLKDALVSLSIPKTHPAFPGSELSTFSIGVDGTIKGIYGTNAPVVLGQIILAKFNNPGGLTKLGGNNYSISANSGTPSYGKGNNNGFGDIQQSTLEMSNVDLASEFTDMIITSRAFQANSRIITTSDEMLQELLNLKR